MARYCLTFSWLFRFDRSNRIIKLNLLKSFRPSTKNPRSTEIFELKAVFYLFWEFVEQKGLFVETAQYKCLVFLF